jgi:hypothetical protein
MPNIQEYDAGNVSLRPTETGVEARAGTARRVGGFYNQQAGATEMLARETERLGGETAKLGSETAALGERKGSATADTGRRLGSSIADAGDVAVKSADAQQISHGNVAYANLFAQKTAQLQGILKNADPNDPTVLPKFMESLNDDLAKFKDDGFYTENGQKFAEAHVDALRQHLTEATIAGMSERAGEAVKINAQQSLNSLSSAVHNDPSQANVDFALAASRSGLEGSISSSPTLSGAHAGVVRDELNQKNAESIIKSAAIGYVTQNGKLPPWLNDPKYAKYVNGAELKQFEQAAKVQTKANEWTQKQLDTAQRKETEDKAAKELSVNWTKNVTYDETGQVHVNPQAMQNILDIERKYPGAATSDSQKMISFLQAQQREKREVVNSDQAVRADLLQRMSSLDKFPTEIEILRAQAEHKLSPADAREMRELQQAIVQRPGGDAIKRDHAEFFKQYGPTIDAEMKLGNPTPLGAQALFRAEMDAYRQEDSLRQKGLDPHLVYDPRSEYFFGSPKNISGYRPTMQDQANYKAQLKADQAGTTVAAPALKEAPEIRAEPPPALRGIADLQFSAKLQRYRDNASGKIYNKDGSEVKQ